MSEKSNKAKHTVLVGEDFHLFRDLERAKANQLKAALEERYPSSSSDFTFKLLPLSVGACLLIIGESSPRNRKGHKHRRADRIDCEAIECEFMNLDIEEVLFVASELVKRWRSIPNADP